MAEYLFKLKETSHGILTDKSDQNKEHYGVKLIYDVYRLTDVKIFGKRLRLSKKCLGQKIFLRPSRKDWDKYSYKLPHAYWGKKGHNLTRLWIVVQHAVQKDNKILVIPEVSLINHKIELFGKTFISHAITKHLFKRDKDFIINNTNK